MNGNDIKLHADVTDNNSLTLKKSDKEEMIDKNTEENEIELQEQGEAQGSIPIDKIDLNALWVVRRLRAKGYDAYLTGGCVRDLLLNKSPKDFDVATSAKPEEVKSIFRNCRLIGRRFLLAHVVFPGGKVIETATFRANPLDEVEEENPSEDLLVLKDNVFGSIQDDAFRRDLTINGLFYDPVAGKVIDYVGGLQDLKNGLIRIIGDPEVRLQEDPVRILRAIRFSKVLGFEIEEKTLLAMKKYCGNLIKCAPARLQEEIVRLLLCKKAKECFELALEVGALNVLMPELLEGFCGKAHLPPEDEHINFSADEIKNSPAYPTWLKTLSSMDEISQRGCQIFSSVAFTCLLLPVYQFLEGSDQNERNWIDRLCVSWAERIRLTRRDQDIIRVLLSAIPLFSLEKIHQESAKYLVRKPWFREALLVYIMHLNANNASLEPVSIWKRLAFDAQIPYMQDKVGLDFFKDRARRSKPVIKHKRRFNKFSLAR